MSTEFPKMQLVAHNSDGCYVSNRFCNPQVNRVHGEIVSLCFHATPRELMTVFYDIARIFPFIHDYAYFARRDNDPTLIARFMSLFAETSNTGSPERRLEIGNDADYPLQIGIAGKHLIEAAEKIGLVKLIDEG